MPTLPKLRSTPTRQNTGTSYTATPAAGVKPPGLGEMGSARGTRIVDPVPQLTTQIQAIRTYKQMARADASVRISLRAGKTPVLGGYYYIDAYDEAPENEAIAEFVDFNLFHGQTIPFLQILEDVLRMFEHGFSVLEPVWELREWAPKLSSPTANRRQYTMLRKLAVRPATTISNFIYDDNGGPAGALHNAIKADNSVQQVTIPIEKLIIFSFDREGGNLEGQSLLRSAYQHWFYKDLFYKIDGIQKERHGIGVPDIELQPGYSDADVKAANELGSNLRTNEKAHIVRPPGLKVGFAELHGNLADALKSAEHHDNMIMKNVMVQFLNLGGGVTGGGGGRATGATSADMFLKSMRYIGNLICDCFNLYLIPNLVAYNFPTDQFPKMKVRNIGETKDLQLWGSAMASLVDKGLITMDLETEQFVRDIVDFPTKLGDRPEFTPQQVRENILLQGTANQGITIPPGTKSVPPTPTGPSGADGSGGGGTGRTSGYVGKNPTSGI